MILVIDGSKIKTSELLHEYLKHNLNLPDYYGRNLDALWDMLSAWVSFPLIIIIKNSDLMEKNLGHDYFCKIINLMQRAEEELKGFNYIVINSPKLNLT